jgi:hypothetical protein
VYEFLQATCKAPEREFGYHRVMKAGALGRTCAALSLPALALAAVGLPAQDDPAAEAHDLLQQAEEKVRDGRHADAVRLYEKIAAKYRGTPAAEVAARRALPSAYLGQADVLRNGPSENRVDIVIMGDGYELGKLKGFDKLALDVPSVFERNEVFGEYLAYINVLRADVVSEDSGIDAYNREKRTALGGAMSDGEQSQVTVDRVAVKKILGTEMPAADGMAIVLVPLGTLGTGGGGVAAVAAREFDTLIHEWGHAFAHLKDEYSTFTGYRGETEQGINVSDTPDEKRVPWAHFLDAKVRGVGVYEGADGKVKGAWKPTSAGCIMGEGEFYCPVCREAIVLRIHEFVDPIDVALPEPAPDGGEPIRVARDAPKPVFEVQVMQPASHRLEVSWWLFRAGAAPPAAPYLRDAADEGERGARGKLAPIERKPDEFGRNAKDGRYSFSVNPKDLEPGEYLIFVRAVDTTELRGERWPWVLKDERELLKSERVWRLVVE